MAVTPSREELEDLFPSIGKEHWGIDPRTTFLNHGSFGACPKPVLAEQHRLRLELEANPLRFLLEEAPELLKQSKANVAGSMIRVLMSWWMGRTRWVRPPSILDRLALRTS